MTTMNGFMPFLNLTKNNYERWGIHMKEYIGGQDVREAIKEEYKEPEDFASLSRAQKSITKEARVKYQNALSLIQLSVDDAIFEKIVQATTANNAWDVLRNTFKEIDKVKKVCLQSLRGEFVSSKMKDT